MNRRLAMKLITMSVSLFLALTVSHFLVYKDLIVPHLQQLSSVPLSWWLGMFVPGVSILLIFGFSGRSWSELLLFSVVAGLIEQLFAYLMAVLNEPGYSKVYESAVSHWTLGLLAVSLISAIPLVLGMLLGKIIKPRMKFA